MMILLNVKLTEIGLGNIRPEIAPRKYERADWLPKYSRVDIFKYCLASYAVLLPLVTRCEFYIELAPEVQHQKQELELYIKDLFPPDKLNLNWYRHSWYPDWKKWEERTLTDDNELIWWAGNDDHIFVDNSLEVIQNGLDILRNDPNPLSQIYLTHWPEQTRLAKQFNAVLCDDNNYVVRDWWTTDSMAVMKTSRWKKYLEHDWQDFEMWRTDLMVFVGNFLKEITAPVYTPTKELVRHYDGYSHRGKAMANAAPPLFIPPNFFEKQMKIRYGFLDRDNSCTNINPVIEDYYNQDINGTDYRMVLEDIPLFWQDRIQSIEIGPTEENAMIISRNEALIKTATVPLDYTEDTSLEQRHQPPLDWFMKHLRLTKS